VQSQSLYYTLYKSELSIDTKSIEYFQISVCLHCLIDKFKFNYSTTQLDAKILYAWNYIYLFIYR